MLDLTVIWFLIIGFGVLVYVILDGFDLGIGILLPFIKNKDEQDTMINTVAPVWDGNETWMVLGGAGLYAAFPLVYSTVLSALYMPIFLMAIALIFRGVSFEFRIKAEHRKTFWNRAFIAGSILSSFLQGVILAAVIQGIQTTNGIFSGNTFDWLTPFTLLSGVGVVVMYAVLGCAWLILKTSDRIQSHMFQLLPKLIWILGIVFLILLVLSPFAMPHLKTRWFAMPNLIVFIILLSVMLALFALVFKSIQKKKEVMPFIVTLSIMIVAFLGLVLSIFPMIIPPYVDIWQAAAPESSQRFILVGAIIFIPLVIAYTVISYWVFRHKVHIGDEGYH